MGDHPDRASPGAAAAPGPWRAWSVGERVVVRRRLAAGSPQPYTDVLGDLVAVADDGVTVRTRAGEVHVPGDEIAIGKVVPPAPPRRRPRRTEG